MSLRVLPYGDAAVLVEADDLDEAVSLHRTLLARPRRGVLELIPAARTVLVRLDPAVLPLSMAQLWLTSLKIERRSLPEGPLVTVRVRYDGRDLAETAAQLGLRVDELIERHTSTTWRSAFVGFAPGFAYLTARRWRLDVPRRATSRERVPAGSVALAGAFSGVYPRESPGGWQLIGTTDAVLWDEHAASPALLEPGSRVRFEAVTA